MEKIVWIYWHQGWENAPEICKVCCSSWQKFNPDWEIKKLDSKSLSHYIDLENEIPNLYDKSITNTALSDIIRILLLKNHGGIWVDSTLLCRAPLDSWIYEYEAHGFFAFDKPGADRLVSSWFLLALKDNYIIDRWHTATIDFWKERNSTEEYFWFHYLFNGLYENNKKFSVLWNNTPKISADIPHFFLPYENTFFEKLTPAKRKEIEENNAPVFKLTYKYENQRDRKNTVLDYILSSIPLASDFSGIGMFQFIKKIYSHYFHPIIYRG